MNDAVNRAMELITAGLVAGTIRQTPMDLPPMLLAGVGYNGEARFVSLYWMPGGDELMVDDGQVAFTGSWQAYVAWSRHVYVRAHTPQGFTFGASDMEHTHRWLIDRTDGRIYAGLDDAIRQVVRGQWPPAPPAPPLTVTADQWDEITANVIAQFRQIQPPSMDAIMESMEAEARLCRLLTTWLDEQYTALITALARGMPGQNVIQLGPEDPGGQAIDDADKRRN